MGGVEDEDASEGETREVDGAEGDVGVGDGEEAVGEDVRACGAEVGKDVAVVLEREGRVKMEIVGLEKGDVDSAAFDR